MNSTAPKESFLSTRKTSLYLGLSLLGLFCKIMHWPGSVFILVGLGLFYGHLFFRAFRYDGLLLIRIIAPITTAFIIAAIVKLKFDTGLAFFLVLSAFIISLVIEWLTRNYRTAPSKSSVIDEGI